MKKLNFLKWEWNFVFQLRISKAIIIKIKIYIMPRPGKGKRGSKIQTNTASQSIQKKVWKEKNISVKMVKEHGKISQKRNVTDQYGNICSTVY